MQSQITELNGKPVKLFKTNAEVQERIRQVAETFNVKYKNSKNDVICIGILNGAFMFYADVVKHFDFKLKADFIRTSSYTDNKQTDEVKVFADLKYEIEGQHVIIIEDIIDTGKSMLKVIDFLSSMKPASIEIISLIGFSTKQFPEAITSRLIYLFESNGGFFVGYGFDSCEYYRNLPDIYYHDPTSE